MTYGLPSTEEQIAAIRAESELSITHIDTCLSSFLHDHHNRPGECLFGVYVDGRTTRADVLQGLLDEINQTGDRVPSFIQYDEIKGCAKALFADAYGTSEAALSLPFDSSLDITNDDDLESADMAGDEVCQAWFLLIWTPTDEEIAD